VRRFFAIAGNDPQSPVMSSQNRRMHRMFETLHTEYHLRLDECVGVRDKHSGEWYRDHPALRLRAIQVPSMGSDAEFIGRRLQFWGEFDDVTTSPVIGVTRPMRTSLRGYVSLACAGEIAA
jgi:hypothetical protein